MADDSEEKTLHPAMNADRIRTAIKRSEELNELAWQQAEELGPDSRLFKKSDRHWKRLLSFQIPEAPEDQEAFERATFLAWWACWRARDYSRARIHEQVRQSASGKRIQWRDATNVHVAIAGVHWPVTHIPFPYLGSEERLEVQRQLNTFRRGQVLESFGIAADAFNEGVILNKFDGINGNVNWSADWQPIWCFFDQGSPVLAHPENCYISEEPSGAAIRFSTGCNYSVFRRPTEMSNYDAKAGISSSRFSVGLTIRNLNTDNTFTLPNSIETGKHLSLTGGAKSQRIKIESTLGVRELRIEELDSGTLTVNDQKLTSLSLAHAQDHNRLSLCWLQNSELDSLKLNGACADRLKVQDCTFNERVDARDCNLKAIQFESSDLLDEDCSFDGRNLRLRDGLTLIGCTIRGEIDLADSAIEKLIFGMTKRGRRNIFQSPVIAKSTVETSKRVLGTIDIKNSDFNDEVTFENREFRERTAFEDCTFHRAPRFQSCEFNFDTSFRRTKFEWKPYVLAKKGRERDDRLSVTEGSFRTLAKQMETIKAHDYQSKFHVEQMRARFMRKDGGEVPFWDRLFAAGYGLFAAYGSSFVRPFLWLIAVWVIATVSYFFLAYSSGLSNSVPLAAGAFALGLTLTFRPFFVFNPIFGRVGMDTCGSGAEVCGSTQLAAFLTQNCEIGFKLIGLVHSIFSTLFIFLILLSLRRKFQLS